MKKFSLIEPLEDRIAPASIINPYTVTYQDGGGDTAVIRVSKPLFTSAKTAANILHFVDNSGNAITETFSGNSTAENLSIINLLGRAAASGMNLSVKVLPQVGVGNLTVNVGLIDAANFTQPDQVTQGIDLGSVYIQGNLGQIFAGDHFATPAVRSLTALSMTTPAESALLGPITSLNIQGDFNANLSVSAYQFGSIGKLTIAGTLGPDANDDAGTGVISFTGHIGSATIGNIVGGSSNSTAIASGDSGATGNNTGELIGSSADPSFINSLHILGNIQGGGGSNSAEVSALAKIGKVTVDGSVTGGAGANSGMIEGPLGSVKIAGSVTGGNGTDSGAILSQVQDSLGNVTITPIGNVTIGGSLIGGTSGVAASGSTAATPGDSGIISATSAKSILIGGSLTGATGSTYVSPTTGGTITASNQDTGAILVNSFKSLSILGSVSGGAGTDSGVVMGNATESLFGTSIIPKVAYGDIYIGGSVAGGSASDSGSILANGLFGGTLSNLRIGGNLQGGTANGTGEILVTGNLAAAAIGGNIVGNTSLAANVVGSAYIQAGYIGSLHIAGSVTAGAVSGSVTSAVELANCGAIRSTGAIGSITIGGSVNGTAPTASNSATSYPGTVANPFIISATHGTGKSKTSDIAMQSITIGGSASYMDILAGYAPPTTAGSTIALGTPTDGSASMGDIMINGSMSASNIVAGVEPDSNGNFGNLSNTIIPAHVINIPSMIASLIVTGQTSGDGGTSTASNSFGIVAEQLPSVTLDGTSYGGNNITADKPVSVDNTNLFVLVLQ